jgi:hypothetical protein
MRLQLIPFGLVRATLTLSLLRQSGTRVW